MPAPDVVDLLFQNVLNDFWVNTLPGQSNVTQWDKLILGPYQMPGLWTLELDLYHEHFNNKFNTNQTGNPNLDSYKITMVDKGYTPATLHAVGKIWTVDQWLTLKKILPNINPKKINATRQAFDITHPAASLLGVNAVIVDRARVLPPVDQTLFVNIGMTQAYDFAQMTGTLGGAGQNGITNAGGPSPNDAENLA